MIDRTHRCRVVGATVHRLDYGRGGGGYSTKFSAERLRSDVQTSDSLSIKYVITNQNVFPTFSHPQNASVRHFGPVYRPN